MPRRDELVAYFGHHKCATQWMRRVVADVCPAIGREQVVFSGVQDFDKDLVAAIHDPGATFLCYQNADARFVRPLGNMRGFHIVRDPRDVVVSAYYSHLYSHNLFGKLGEYREKLQSVPEAEGLMLELENRLHQFRVMLDWNYNDPRILELRMEDVTGDAATYLPQIFDFLGLGPEQGLDGSCSRAPSSHATSRHSPDVPPAKRTSRTTTARVWPATGSTTSAPSTSNTSRRTTTTSSCCSATRPRRTGADPSPTAGRDDHDVAARHLRDRCPGFAGRQSAPRGVRHVVEPAGGFAQ